MRETQKKQDELAKYGDKDKQPQQQGRWWNKKSDGDSGHDDFSSGISDLAASRIQSFASRYNVKVVVVGSRATNTATAVSDYDYIIIGGDKSAIKAARRELPRGLGGGEISAGGEESGIDVFSEHEIPLDTDRPHIIFDP